MMLRRRLLLSLLFLILFVHIELVAARFDPYATLGVHRRADVQEIRRAYKRLAREYHPDKNDAKEAQDRFIEITKAYELLSDPERRRGYDNHGITEENSNFRKHKRFEGFDSNFGFFSDIFGHRFESETASNNIFAKHMITSKAYYNVVLPKSQKQPYLILIYSDWCFTCARVQPIWTRLCEELEPIGFGMATVHSELERDLIRKIGARELPHLVMILDSKVIHYKDAQFSAVKVLEFVRRKFPWKIVSWVDNEEDLSDFLSGWNDNKIRVVFVGRVDVIRLRYLTSAFKYRERAAFAYIKATESYQTRRLAKKLGVNEDKDSLLLYHEDTTVPVVSMSMKELTPKAISDVVESNLYLQLPRLSSQRVFDSLCPWSSSRSRKRLCVILITHENDDEGLKGSFRSFVTQEQDYSVERVRFVYLVLERQRGFVQDLITSSKEEKGDFENDHPNSVDDEYNEDHDESDYGGRVVVVWRRESNRLKFEWLKNKWSSKRVKNSTKDELKAKLDRLLIANEVLSMEALLTESLVDEHLPNWLGSFFNKMLELTELLRENVTKDELLPALSIIATLALVVAGGYFMHYLVQMEEQSVQRQLGSKGMRVDRHGKIVPELKIHELRAETYNGMIRLLKPGCRTLVLIVDRESKEKLVPQFYKLAWPYRRNRTLMFGFMYIEKGLAWYKKILQLTLPEPRDININPKNCIGTVLAVNGLRRYFCMYHAKHPEGSRKRIYTANNGSVAGAFMGFDSDLEDSSSEETDIETGANLRRRRREIQDEMDQLPIFEDQLLDGLPMWLDRLFEGSTFRYHVNYWPEFPISPTNFGAQERQQREHEHMKEA